MQTYNKSKLYNIWNNNIFAICLNELESVSVLPLKRKKKIKKKK
jgi:hypothetical protein